MHDAIYQKANKGSYRLPLHNIYRFIDSGDYALSIDKSHRLCNAKSQILLQTIRAL